MVQQFVMWTLTQTWENLLVRQFPSHGHSVAVPFIASTMSVRQQRLFLGQPQPDLWPWSIQKDVSCLLRQRRTHRQVPIEVTPFGRPIRSIASGDEWVTPMVEARTALLLKENPVTMDKEYEEEVQDTQRPRPSSYPLAVYRVMVTPGVDLASRQILREFCRLRSADRSDRKLLEGCVFFTGMAS